MQTLELPESVKGRTCFQQFVGALAVDAMFFDQAVATIRSVGMPAIWAASDKNPPHLYSESIYAIAASLLTQGVDVVVPDAKSTSPAVDDQGVPAYAITNGTAIIPVNGPLSKQTSSLQSLFGGSNTVGMRKALALAMADSRVERVMFHIDSPGGTVAGTGDLGDDIFAASSKKPVASFIEDMGTSAAYWLAAQTEVVYASQYANVGSIGVIWTVMDTSEAAAKEGIKVHAITSSPGKAFAVDGMPITKQQLAKMQAHVDATYQHFLGAVARGRGVDLAAARTMSGDADIYNAETALQKGLVDAVVPFRTALADFAANAQMRFAPAQVAYAVNMRKRVPTATQTLVISGVTVDSTGTDLPLSGSVESRGSVSNTLTDIVALEESPVTPEPEPASPKAVAPVSLTPEAHAALVTKADKGEQALKIVQEMQVKADNAAKASLDAARERIMADYGASKERVQACPDLASLGALEAVYRERTTQRSGADPNAAKQPKDVSAEAEDTAEIADFKATQMKTAATFANARTPEV